jgi:hypothetical protein
LHWISTVYQCVFLVFSQILPYGIHPVSFCEGSEYFPQIKTTSKNHAIDS